ncbi:unnamed protein product, partial [Prorocentrum cordatum]
QRCTSDTVDRARVRAVCLRPPYGQGDAGGAAGRGGAEPPAAAGRVATRRRARRGGRGGRLRRGRRGLGRVHEVERPGGHHAGALRPGAGRVPGEAVRARRAHRRRAHAADYCRRHGAGAAARAQRRQGGRPLPGRVPQIAQGSRHGGGGGGPRGLPPRRGAPPGGVGDLAAHAGAVRDHAARGGATADRGAALRRADGGAARAEGRAGAPAGAPPRAVDAERRGARRR